MSSAENPIDVDAWAKGTVPYTEGTNQQNPGDTPPVARKDRRRRVARQDDSTPTTVTTWRHKLSLAFLVSLAVIVVAVALVCLVRNQLFCYRIIAPFKDVEYFPLPLPVSRSAHEVVLGELHYPEDVLSSLIDQHTEVRLIITYTSEELVKSFARAAAMCACPDSNDTRTSFREEINTARKQLSSAVAALRTLAQLYYNIRKDYDTLHSSAVEAFEAAQLSDYREKRRQQEEIRLGVVALKREVRRLELILRVVQKLQDDLLVLDGRVSSWHAKVERDCFWRQEQLQEWLRDPDWHRSLKQHWNKLLATVDDGEENLAIKITTEWCER